MRVELTKGLPIKMWLDDIEEGALKQARNLAKLPFAFRHITLLSDCHQGYGMPIGGVLATDGVVVVNAVGVDIACGVVAVRTNLIDLAPKQLRAVLGRMRQVIPTGFNHHAKPQPIERMPDSDHIDEATAPVCTQQFERAQHQLGTLGSGNHFAELQRGDGSVWIMIHSGSRNLGKKVADRYNAQAKALNKCWHSSVDPTWQLAFLPHDDDVAQQYLVEHDYCREFARASRRLMLDRTLDVLTEVTGQTVEAAGDVLDVHHNYVRAERHFGRDVLVHRKGATSARKDELGIIPGSQGTNSFIVRGLGNRDSFMSCSHGAGRRMGRKAAIRDLDLDDQIGKLDRAGVIHSLRSKKDLDEAPDAYKDIHDVMAQQTDLVDIVTELRPLAVLKG